MSMLKFVVQILLSVIFVSLLSSCTKKTCAAYHSAFIHHQGDREAFFAYFTPDSVARVDAPKFAKEGLVKGVTLKNFKKRHYIVPMKDYYGSPKDEYPFETNATDIDNMGPPK